MPLSAALLSNHRRVAPFGLAGGAPGACGRQWVERAGGSIEPLAGCAKTEMRPGDVFVIQTPAGGGFGAPEGGGRGGGEAPLATGRRKPAQKPVGKTRRSRLGLARAHTAGEIR